MKFNSFEELREYCSMQGTNLLGVPRSEALLGIPGITGLPIEPRRGSSQKVARIRFASNSRDSLSAVLWDCLFGVPRVSHWFLLFNLLDRLTKYDDLAQEIFNVMMIINEKSPSGAVSEIFNIRLRSVRAILGADIANEMKKRLRLLGLSVPQKKPSLKMSLTIETIHFRKTPPVRRIGVGYKDKGSLGLPGSEYDPTEIPTMKGDPNKVWGKLLRTYKRNFHR